MSTKRPHLLSLVIILALLLPGAAQPAATHWKKAAVPALAPAQSAPSLQPDFGQLPLYFVENRGQLDEQVAYYVQGADKTIYFTPEDVTFAITRGAPKAGDDAHDRLREYSLPACWAVKLDFLGANPDVRPVAQEPAEAVISYFKGRPDARLTWTNAGPDVEPMIQRARGNSGRPAPK